MHERFEEYPKLKELIRLKDGMIRDRATQPMYLRCDLKAFDLSSLGTKFDVVQIEPPLEEYQRRASGINFAWSPWDWEDVREGGKEGRKEGGRERGRKEGGREEGRKEKREGGGREGVRVFLSFCRS